MNNLRQKLETTDRFVPHVSTVPANRSRMVGLHLREKVLAGTLERDGAARTPVVLFIHGGYSPAVVAYDLDYRDYSWMGELARAGFDVFAMTHTGYGGSPKPMMDDPCNVDRANQSQLVPKVLKEACAPRYPYKLVSSRTEWDEIETVVGFITALRKVEKVSLIGWSTGAPRAGGFAAMHPGKVDKLVLLAPSPFFPSDTEPDRMPEPGAPVILQSREMLMNERWGNHVRASGQIEHPEVPDIMWRALMFEDGLGEQWGPDGVGVMRAPSRTNFGWRANAARVTAPTLVMLGEHDNYNARRDAWGGLASAHKAFVKISNATHFVQYERARHVVHQLTENWLRRGEVPGATRPELAIDWEGKLRPLD
ncbi:MAG TPA: alpha/beta fold hydrolase [Burkholderiales bacterium]|nr:alpha/beta fold hydrolase [Burkholderiales bacterium]